MRAARGVARVRRDVLAARMTCPLCQGLLREATAITHCLHTFCRECIMEKINDDEVECCPVCNIDLGCDPEEKLRPDHNLQDIRNKLFPIKKKKVDSLKAPTTLPAKRKQRSLSSLVVDTPSVEKWTGLTGKRTKAKRRAAASRATSSSNNGTMKLPAKSEGRDQKTEKTSALQSTKVAKTAKKNESRDQKIEKASAQQSTKAAIAANKKQRSTDVEVSSKPYSEDKKNAKKADKVVHAARKAKAPRSTPKIHGATEEQIKKKGSELPIRKEETENEVNIPGTTVAKRSNELSHREGAENEVNIPGTTVENNGTSSEPAPSTDQATTEDNSNQGLSGSASTLHDPITTPVWFSLVSSPNQKGDLQLPELSKSYLRIKDGSLQISFVQRWRSYATASRSAPRARCTGWWTFGRGESRRSPSRRRWARRPRSTSWCCATAAATAL
ncbi:E3 ubiquitin protein ligase DRIP2 isoform X1 [Setaria viridis]|uniref:E3 ubiquitin protein ligase DRIP2 isoform X1 n=1 Tax=Setaria viridis TaxID=4556 RepID=UPI003B3A905F